jgi:hypothetical protein
MEVTVSLLLSVLILVAALAAWNYIQVRTLNQRLSALEKEHLALVQDLENRMFRG